MKKWLVGCACAVLLTGSAQDKSLTLWHDFEGKKWESHPFPIGNGHMGCMIFGGIDKEEIQFNVDSLWTGDENPSGKYNSMGAYQNFGSVIIEFAGAGGVPVVTCPSGHKSWSAAENVAKSWDGNVGTKWCVEHKNKAVQWQMSLPKAQKITSYVLTSGNDSPERDPSDWVLEGSVDGKSWNVIDKKVDQSKFQARGKAKAFTITTHGSYRHYRFTFTKNNGGSRYQLSEIALTGVRKAKTSTPATDYRRELDMGNAIHTISYRKDGVTFTRTAFSSYPDGITVITLTADKKARYSGRILIRDGHDATPSSDNKRITVKGALKNGLKYEAILDVQHIGGTVSSKNGALVFNACDELTLFLAADTNYVMDYSKQWRGGDPHQRLNSLIANAKKRSLTYLRDRHVKDFKRLFDRVAIDLGTTSPEIAKLSLQKRLKTYKQLEKDPDLEELLFQYGRYLLIGCSRQGTLPANLQGLWNNRNKPPWNSDYHTNINVQMNYWLAEPSNLAECHRPFIDLTKAMTEPSRKATRKAFGPGRGFTYRTSHNPFGGHGWQWNIPASAWYAQHLWEHYAFGLDRKYLKETAYPYIKEVVQYWEDHLKRRPDGKLVVPNGWSPEHGPREDGVAHDQQIVWDLFSNFINASTALGVDKEYRDKIAKMRDELLGPKIGKWGQLQEWVKDRDNPKDHHRHTSQLFAVYPGFQISLEKTPAFAKAAMVSLKARGSSGDSRRSWTWPWRCALWARFQQGEKGHEMIRGLLKHNTLTNLIATHPPLQLDGSFGITAGMCELFLQSHTGVIHLLPALPSAYPEGHVTGLRARGGFVVDQHWSGGELTTATITATTSGPCHVKASRKLSITSAGKNVPTTKKGDGISFKAQAGKSYLLK